jgi:hypothetical protein
VVSFVRLITDIFSLRDKLATGNKKCGINCVVENNAFYRFCKDATMKFRYAYLFVHAVVCTVDVINDRFVRAQYVEAKSTGGHVEVILNGSEEVCLTP